MGKKILLIGHSGDLYGASRSLIKLTNILSSAGNQVFVLIPEKGPIFEQLLLNIPEEQIISYSNLYIFTRKSFKLRYVISTIYKFLGNILNIAGIIRRNKIDVVHTNSGVVPAGALAAKIMGKNHFWHIREWFGDFRSFWPLYSSYMTAFSDRIICVSKTMSAQFKKSDKVVAIYNGFSLPEKTIKPDIDPTITRKLDNADLVIGCTSRIRLIRKGQEYLIEAVGMLTERTKKNIQIILVGDFVTGYEDQSEVLESLIEKFHLQGRVHFFGHVPDAIPYYSMFDLFVLPSGEPEPFGGVVMEAMSMGLPIVGSNVGGTTEQVKAQWNGYLFENQNAGDLANKIEPFLSDKRQLQEFGMRSVERIKTHFSLEIHKSKILELYNSI